MHAACCTGPFKSDEMLDWMRNGYFRMDLLIRRACDKEFKTLGMKIGLVCCQICGARARARVCVYVYSHTHVRVLQELHS